MGHYRFGIGLSFLGATGYVLFTFGNMLFVIVSLWLGLILLVCLVYWIDEIFMQVRAHTKDDEQHTP